MALTETVNRCDKERDMEKFKALPQQRQDSIVAAAMGVFGAVGYKKAYISDIAEAAGISKALVFHYFGTKKALYLFLMGHTGEVLMGEMQGKQGGASTDFFDRIIDATELKLATMARYPAMSAFLTSMYYEEDPEVAPEIRQALAQGDEVRTQIAFDGTDEGKFKEGVDPKLVMNILVKFTEGVLGSHLAESFSIDELMREFTDCVNLLKDNLYREEYLQ